MFVILNEVKNLIESISYKTEILPCLPAGANASDLMIEKALFEST